MNSKIISGIIVSAIVIISVSFFAGTKFNQKTTATVGDFTRGQNLGMPPGNFQTGTRANRTGMLTGGFSSGEVISKDDKSITIKLQSGGSKIIFLSSKTSVTKSVSGTQNDLAIGNQVMVTGTGNPDGSITGETIQIRPDQVVKTK